MRRRPRRSTRCRPPAEGRTGARGDRGRGSHGEFLRIPDARRSTSGPRQAARGPPSRRDLDQGRPRHRGRPVRQGGVLAPREAQGRPGDRGDHRIRAGGRGRHVRVLRLRCDRARIGRGVSGLRVAVRVMSEPRATTVLFDAGGVLLDLDYAFLKRLLEARQVVTTVSDLATSESLARAAIDRRVREGGRVSEAWRDYFRIILTRVGAPPERTEAIIDTL